MDSKEQLFSSPQLHKRNHRKIIDSISNTYSTSSYKFSPNPQIQNKQYLRSKRLNHLSIINQYRNPFVLADEFDYRSVDQLRNSRVKTENYVKLPLIKSNKRIQTRMSPYDKLNSRQIYNEPTVSLITKDKGKQKEKEKDNSYKRICSVNCLQHSKKKQKKTQNKQVPSIRKYLIQQKQAKHFQTQLNRYLQKMKVKQEEYTNRYFYQTFFGLQPQFYKLQTEYAKRLCENQKYSPFIVSKKVREHIASIPDKDELASFVQQYNPFNKEIIMQTLLKSQKFIIQYSHNQLYFGQMIGNRKQGFGIFIQDKKVFQGYFRNNYKVKGIQINSSGIYKGLFFNEKRDGDGQFQWLNGEYYIGEWSQGNRHGRGVWTNRNGDSYNGQWVMGKGQGYGVYIVEGAEYKGNFMDFKKEGFGRQKFINGDVYEGQFMQGYPSGKGKYTWSNGTKYQGQFITGLRNGKGVLKTLDGFCYVGQFLDERPEGLCEIFMPNGDKYHGYLRDGKKNGRGTLFLKDLEKVFDGQWQDDYFVRNYTL